MTTLLDVQIKEPRRILIERDEDGKITCTVTPIEKPVEKFEPEDGDILTLAEDSECVFIYNSKGTCKTSFYAGICSNDSIAESTEERIYGMHSNHAARSATEEEKQRLFDALEKAGKRWNAEKKQIEVIPKEPKVGD